MLNPLTPEFSFVLFFILSLFSLCSITGSFVLRCPIHKTPGIKGLKHSTQLISFRQLKSIICLV